MEAIVRPILSVIHGRLVPVCLCVRVCVCVYVSVRICVLAARARITGRRILCARRGTSRHLRYRVAYIVRRDGIVSLRLR